MGVLGRSVSVFQGPRVVDIASAADAFSKRRFVRATFIVGLVLGLPIGLPLFLAAVLSPNLENFPEWLRSVDLPLRFAAVAIAAFLALTAVVSVALPLLQLVPRRLMGATQVGTYYPGAVLIALYFVAFGVAGAFLALHALGVEVGLRDIFDSRDRVIIAENSIILSVAFFSMMALIVYNFLFMRIQYEYFKWQIFAPEVEYLAVRGWRPSPHQLSSWYRRALMLPLVTFRMRHIPRRLRNSLAVGNGINTVVSALPLVPIHVLLLCLVWFGVFPRLTGEWEIALYWASFAWFAVIATCVLLLVSGIGSQLERYSRNEIRTLYQSVRDWDDRKPVLFLRGFSGDSVELSMKNKRRLLNLPVGLSRSWTLDEILLEQASAFGPVIAIGDPRTSLPPLGAARVFVKGDDWQSIVSSLAHASSAIVVCPGTGEGVAWEIDLVSRPALRDKTIFLLAPDRSEGSKASMRDASSAKEPDAIAAFTGKDGTHWTVVCSEPEGPAYSVAVALALQNTMGVLGIPMGRANA